MRAWSSRVQEVEKNNSGAFHVAGQQSYGCYSKTNPLFLLPTRPESCCLTECSCYSDYCFAGDWLETLLEMSQALLIYFHWGNIRKTLLICFNIFSSGEQSENVTFNSLSFFFLSFFLFFFHMNAFLVSALTDGRALYSKLCPAFAVLATKRTHPSSNPSVCLLSNLWFYKPRFISQWFIPSHSLCCRTKWKLYSVCPPSLVIIGN